MTTPRAGGNRVKEMKTWHAASGIRHPTTDKVDLLRTYPAAGEPAPAAEKIYDPEVQNRLSK